MTAGELRAFLELVPDNALVAHLNGYDVCHIEGVRRTGRGGDVQVILAGRVCADMPTPTVERAGRWPISRPVVDRSRIRDELLGLLREASA